MGNANGNANERFYQIYNVEITPVNYCNTCNMKEFTIKYNTIVWCIYRPKYSSCTARMKESWRSFDTVTDSCTST
jgi:hypothetical protein